MSPSNEKKMREYAKKILKSEMGRTLTKPADLEERLGLEAIVIRNKINRGAFSAGFFLEVLQALGVKEIHIPADIENN